MSKIIWSNFWEVMTETFYEQNLMHRYEFLFNEQNLIRPSEIDRWHYYYYKNLTSISLKAPIL